MYFDFVKNLEIPRRHRQFGKSEDLWKTTRLIEEHVRTQPNEAVRMIRNAMEILMEGLLKEDGYPVTKDVNLFNRIEIYGNGCKFIRNKQVNQLQNLRGKVNKSAHATNKEFTIEEAYKNTKRFYEILGKIFEIDLPEIELEMMPIGHYKVVKKIKAEEFESVCGDYNYLAESDEQNVKVFAYIRLFNKKEDSTKIFDERDADVQAFFRNMRGSQYIMKANEIATGESCGIRYLAYEIQEHTQRLSEVVLSKLSPMDVLEIVSQIAQGLSELSLKNINIHHRGIRPEYIFIDKDDEGYFARLGCFETAKIQVKDKNMQTVMAYMKETQKGNLFIHPVLRNIENADGKDWERGDVYSLCCLFLYCLDHDNFLRGMMNPEVMLDYYSDELEETLEMIFSGQLQTIPLMREFLEILRNEVKNGES